MSVKLTYKELWPDNWYISDGENIHGPLTAIETFSTFEAISQVFSDKMKSRKDNLLVSRKGFSTWYQYRDLQLLYLKGSIGKDTVVVNLKKELLSEIDRLKNLLPQKNPSFSSKSSVRDFRQTATKHKINSDLIHLKSFETSSEPELIASVEKSVKLSVRLRDDFGDQGNALTSHGHEDNLEKFSQMKKSANVNPCSKNQIEDFYLEKYGNEPKETPSDENQFIREGLSNIQKKYKPDSFFAIQDSHPSSSSPDALTSNYARFSREEVSISENQAIDNLFLGNYTPDPLASDYTVNELTALADSSHRQTRRHNHVIDHLNVRNLESDRQKLEEIEPLHAYEAKESVEAKEPVEALDPVEPFQALEKSEFELQHAVGMQRVSSEFSVIEAVIPAGASSESFQSVQRSAEQDVTQHLNADPAGEDQMFSTQDTNLIGHDLHKNTNEDFDTKDSMAFTSPKSSSHALKSLQYLSANDLQMQLSEALRTHENDQTLFPPFSSLAYVHMMIKGSLRLGEIQNPLFVALKSCLWVTIPSFCLRIFQDLTWHLNESDLKKKSVPLWISMFPLINLLCFFPIIKTLMKAESQNQYRSVSFILGCLLSFFPPAIIYYLQLKANKHWRLHVYDYLKQNQIKI